MNKSCGDVKTAARSVIAGGTTDEMNYRYYVVFTSILYMNVRVTIVVLVELSHSTKSRRPSSAYDT